MSLKKKAALFDFANDDISFTQSFADHLGLALGFVQNSSDGLSFNGLGAGAGRPGGGGGGGKPGVLNSYTSGDPLVDDSQEFNIHIDFSGKWMAEQQSLVISAVDAWSKIITGDIRDDLDLQGNLVDDLNITFSIGRIDGSGDILTGINNLAQTGNIVVRDPGTEDQWLPLTASIKLDSMDLKDPDLSALWEAIIMHEIGHALGFAGPIFQRLGLSDGGSFIGSNAVIAYGGAVPLGSDGSHWSETSFGPNGILLPEDLMTTLFSLDQQPVLSDTSVALFADLGYLVLDPSPDGPYLVLDGSWLG